MKRILAAAVLIAASALNINTVKASDPHFCKLMGEVAAEAMRYRQLGGPKVDLQRGVDLEMALVVVDMAYEEPRYAEAHERRAAIKKFQGEIEVICLKVPG